jgi:hypothetical protein
MTTPKNKLLLKTVKSEVVSDIIAPTEIEYYEVVAVGSAIDDIKVGDKVFYHLGANIIIGNEQYVSVNYDDVQVIL